MGASVPVEFKLLVAAVIIGLVNIMWAAAAGSGGQRDLKWLSGPRDEDYPVQSVMAQRLRRSMANFLETFPLFLAVLLACAAAGKLGGTLTVDGSVAYVAGRALYVPLYALGTPLLRSVVWGVSLAGIVMLIVAFFQ
ncbi:MAG: MAPEG family protein [Proteobacteria bacterium]|nr:MAPEG family protein [Pseudomonadota bacterium]